MSNNNKSNNAIQAAGSYYSDKFEFTNQKLREHFQQANKEIDKVKEHVNELVAIVHKDNKSWSIKKICEYIAGKNDDFEELGFSARTIYRYLNDENRKLLDSRIHKRKKGDSSSSSESKALKDFREQKGTTTTAVQPSDSMTPCDAIVLEDSSSSSSSDDMNDAIDSVYDLEDEEDEKRITIEGKPIHISIPPSDDPEKIIKEQKEEITELKQKYADLEQDYERVIPPYEIIETRNDIIDGKKRTQTIHVDPYKRTAWTEQHQR